MYRYNYPFILQDIMQKMVFIGGPRQVGKTTLSKTLLDQAFTQEIYLNWDADKKIILNKQ